MNSAQDDIPKLSVRPSDAAQMLGVSERTLWSWAKQGRIRFLKIGRTVLYTVADLKAFLAGQNGG